MVGGSRSELIEVGTALGHLAGWSALQGVLDGRAWVRASLGQEPQRATAQSGYRVAAVFDAGRARWSPWCSPHDICQPYLALCRKCCHRHLHAGCLGTGIGGRMEAPLLFISETAAWVGWTSAALTWQRRPLMLKASWGLDISVLLPKKQAPCMEFLHSNGGCQRHL